MKNELWQLFLETGAPEAYLLYCQAMKMESSYVSDHPGVSAESHGLQ